MENREGQDDEMSGGMWKAVETGTREIGVGKAEGGRSKRRGGKKIRRKE